MNHSYILLLCSMHVSSESDVAASRAFQVGRGIELWNRDTMVAYREDPFLDSSGRMNIGESETLAHDA